MTRAVLLMCLAKLEEAARAKGLCVYSAIGDPATELEITLLETTLGVVLPSSYRESLRDWNGCTVEIREPAGPGRRGNIHAQWEVMDIRNIIAATEVTRKQMTVAMAGSAVAGQVAENMSRAVVIVYHDDICVFLSDCARDLGESTVRCMNLEYALGEFPPTMYVVATSPDDFLEKCFAQLAKTLETEIYWW